MADREGADREGADREGAAKAGAVAEGAVAEGAVEATGAAGTRLCRRDDVPDGGGRGFVFGAGTARRAVFVLRRGAEFYGYENACPHVGTPLDWVPDRFMDAEGQHILCGTHGALFRVEDGYCVSGPCAGKSLTPAPMEIRGGVLMLADAADD